MSRDRPKDYRKGSGVPDILSIPAEDMLANAKWRTISWRTGTKWHGLHRHALMTMIAYAFLQHRRLATARRKKNSTGRRLSQLCPPCATPSSNSSLDYRRSDARIVEKGFATSGGLSKSAKVVPPAALVLDRKKLAAFSAAAGRFLQFPIGDRRCNRTRASVGNAGGNARPSLTNATLAASRLL